MFREIVEWLSDALALVHTTRAACLAALFLQVMLLLPDQSIEAIRIVTDPSSGFAQRALLLVYPACWLSVAFIYSAGLAVVDAPRRFRPTVLAVICGAVCTAPFIALAQALIQAGSLPFTSQRGDIAWLTNIVFLLSFAMASTASASSSILALLWVRGSDESIYLEIPTVFKIALVILGLFSVHSLIVVVIAGHLYAPFLVFAWAAEFAFIWLVIYVYAFRPYVTAPQYTPLSDRRIELADVTQEFVLFRKFVTLFAMMVFSMAGFFYIMILVALHLFGYVYAPLLVFAWSAIMLCILHALSAAGKLIRLPVIGSLFALMLLFSATGLNENHQVRTVSSEFRPQNLRHTFQNWIKSRADLHEFKYQSEPYPVFLIAAEGGGIRAAYFAAVVLENIQTHCARFSQHTLLMTGVSGGSVGIALFAADLRRKARNAPKLTCTSDIPTGRTGPVATALEADLLSPLFLGMLFPDFFQRFLPFAVPGFDRSRFLEDAIERAWLSQSDDRIGDTSFGEVWHGPTSATPALMLLTTSVETGHRMVISHVDMPGWSGIGLPTLAQIAPGVDLPLHTAAVLSARFPFVTPYGIVQNSGVEHRFVDGGYFENSGLTTILDVIDVIRAGLEDRDARLVVIRIENSRATTNFQNLAGIRASEPPSGFWESLSPIRTMLNTRQARAELSEISLRRTLDEMKEAGIPAEEITFALEPGEVPIPLGWALSETARRDIRRQLGRPSDCQETTRKTNPCAQLRVLRLLGAN